MSTSIEAKSQPNTHDIYSTAGFTLRLAGMHQRTVTTAASVDTPATGARVVVPDAMVAALERLFDAPVDAVQVIVAPRFVRWLHGRHTVATTRRNRIYLAIPGELFITDHRLVLHEYCHVVHQWNTGRLTIARYLAELARNGYWKNRYEVEAREFVTANIARFEELLREFA